MGKCKTAFITGVAGQDGSYLAELLLSKGYRVGGLVRSSGRDVLHNLRPVLDNPDFDILYGDILNVETIQTIARLGVGEIYHLASLSHVGQSFHIPTLSFESTAMATLRLLEHVAREAPLTKVYIASSSEMLSKDVDHIVGDEETPLSAHSPYAAGKVAAHLLARVYRNAFGMFIVSGIAYNHESQRRGPHFVTKKIANGVREFKRTGKPVEIGRIDVQRDWHHADDTVRGMWLAMQHDDPDEYVFASGTARSVETFAKAVCSHFDVGMEAVDSDPSRFEVRPWDVDYLCGNPSKAENLLKWGRKWSWSMLVEDVCKEWPHG